MHLLSHLLILSVFLLSSILPILSSAPRTGLLLDRQADGLWPPRAGPSVSLLHFAQTYVDANTGQNVTVGPNAFLVYGGDLDCCPDVWLSPSENRDDWRFIAGWTTFNDCIGPWIPSGTPDDSYEPNTQSMHCTDNHDRVYFMGGFDHRNATTLSNSVWTSMDHLHWNNTIVDHTGNGFPPRADATCVLLNYPSSSAANHELLAIAGNADSYDFRLTNEVFASQDDGLTWNIRCLAAPFRPRHRSMITVWQDPANPKSTRIYVMGGELPDNNSIANVSVANDVYLSTDAGATWAQLANASWPRRSVAGTLTTPAGLIIVIAGAEMRDMGTWTAVVMVNDVYISFNYAKSWVNCTTEISTVFDPRERPGVVLDEKGYLFFMGGIEYWPSFGENDVWKSRLSLYDVQAVAAACGATEDDIDPYIFEAQAAFSRNTNAATTTPAPTHTPVTTTKTTPTAANNALPPHKSSNPRPHKHARAVNSKRHSRM